MLDALRAASLEHSLTDVVLSMLVGQHLLGDMNDHRARQLVHVARTWYANALRSNPKPCVHCRFIVVHHPSAQHGAQGSEDRKDLAVDLRLGTVIDLIRHLTSNAV